MFGTVMHLSAICIKGKYNFDYSFKINRENNIFMRMLDLKLFSCHSIIMATVITYTMNQLRNIGSNAKSKTFFLSFCLYGLMRGRIIALGIRSKPRPYRRSRGGKDHFNCIHTIIDMGTTRMQSTGLTKSRSIGHGILWSQPIQHQTQIKNSSSFRYSRTLINCRSGQNKTHEIQQTIEENNIDICALTETWMKVEDDLTQLRLYPK